MQYTASELAAMLRDARARTLSLVSDLRGEALLGPKFSIVNPPLWEIGHVAWFQERWTLRHLAARESLRRDADALYDSIEVAHDTRWDLLLPTLDETLAYMQGVLDAVLERLEARPLDPETEYFHLLVLYHEDMHDEAFTYTRQTHGYPRPPIEGGTASGPGGPLPGDVEFPGGTFELGAGRELPFVFDNEKWAHPVELRPFRLARAPVTQTEFAAFVDDAGYRRPELWTEPGWRWREDAGAEHPVYWIPRDGSWWRRHYDAEVPLEPHRPVLHVNAHEAEAYCRWAGRRLPTEEEWEYAACFGAPNGKPRFPWGEQDPTPGFARLDGLSLDCAPVDACPAGDSAQGCRQLTGNVWEWTATPFGPFPGFVVDPYKDYSEPWFGDHRVLRGGCLVTRARLLRNTWRNFYTPDRRDVFAGFRTAAIE